MPADRSRSASRSRCMQDFASVGDRDFAGFAGRECASVGGQVGEGHVDLVADGRDHRQPRSDDGADDDFFIERPEVFHAAAAASDDDHVDTGDLVGQRQRGRHFQVGAGTLHAGRGDQHSGAAPAAADDLQHVAHGRAGRARDDHDPAGEAGQRPLAGRVEQSFLKQPGIALAKRQLERPDSLGLEMAGSTI